MVSKNLLYGFIGFLILFLFGYFLFIQPIKTKLSQGKYLYSLYEQELFYFSQLPEKNSKLQQDINSMLDKQNQSVHSLTVDKLASFMQKNYLNIINIQPEENENGGEYLIFKINCSGSYKSLMSFFDELLHSEYWVSLMGVELSEQQFSIRMVVI